jgi:chromosome segregation ATPase
MNAKDLTRQHEQLTQNLQAWRTRRAGVSSRLESARARLEELAGRRATAVAELEPDEKTVGALRKQLTTGRDEIEELEAGLAAADARLAELATAEERAARQVWALTTRQEVEALLSGYAALDRLWAPLLRQLQELAEHEDDVAALLRQGLDGAPPTIGGRELLAVLLWRLNDQLGYPLPDLIRRELMIPAGEHAATRFALVLKQLAAELAN